MAETVQASQQDGHFNESIVNEEILEDMENWEALSQQLDELEV